MIDTTKNVILRQRDRILQGFADLAVQDRKKDVAESYRKQAEFLKRQMLDTIDILIKMNESLDRTNMLTIRGTLMRFWRFLMRQEEPFLEMR